MSLTALSIKKLKLRIESHQNTQFVVLDFIQKKEFASYFSMVITYT